MASKPCCDAGAPVAHEYTPKGSTGEVSGRKLYTVGSSKQALIFIHDIFGFDFKQVWSADPDLPRHTLAQELTLELALGLCRYLHRHIVRICSKVSAPVRTKLVKVCFSSVQPGNMRIRCLPLS